MAYLHHDGARGGSDNQIGTEMSRLKAIGKLWKTGVATLALASGGMAGAALTTLATEPLLAVSTVVKPNLMFILDNSGSMGWDYMPDWASGGDVGFTTKTGWKKNSSFNKIYYDPAIRYAPPLRADGTSFQSMTTLYTDKWREVPNDGFGIQNTSTSDLTSDSRGVYYYFVADTFCNALDLKVCRSSASNEYRYPALLRWCKTDASTDCRATRSDTHTRPRVPSDQRAVALNTNGQYGDKGSPNKAATRTDCALNYCTYQEEMTNFANWWAYYRTRMQMAKSAISFAFNDVTDSFRLGFLTINPSPDRDFLNIQDATTAHKAEWYKRLLTAIPNGGTPLRTALSLAGRYYAGKSGDIYNKSAIDPMQYACQRNYTLLSTDGYWNDSVTPLQISDKDVAFEKAKPIGDQDGNKATVARPYYDSSAIGNTLADVAQYFYLTDIRSDALGNSTNSAGDVGNNDVEDKQQRMHTSTIGLGASGQLLYQSDYATAITSDYRSILNGTLNWPAPAKDDLTTIDDLWHAAINGRGTYYSAGSPDEVRNGVQAFITEVGEGAATSATTSAISTRNLSDDDNFAFKSSYTSGSWFGDLIKYRLNATTGESLSAMWSQSEPYDTDTGKTSPLLDARTEARLIYTADPDKPKGAPLPFKWESLTKKMKAYFQIAAIGTLSQFCASGHGCLQTLDRKDSDTGSEGKGTGVGGINLVNYLRGDKINEGKDSVGYYRVRSHLLGDIIDARPVYVKKPLFNYRDKGYGAFRTEKSARQGMVYAAANDGMVHAFNADGGAEAWAYIPSLMLPKLYKLADKKYAEKHEHFINATPAHGDVYDGENWRTILVGGFGNGARGYYALDVTNPVSPSVLWEVAHDTSRGTGYTVDADVGYTYGTPVITKIADGTWVVIITSGYNNVSTTSTAAGTGRGIVWVLDALTGAVLRKIDTGKGSTTTPSGLAHISAYADNMNVNNITSRIYGGDLLGNLWRIDISGLTKVTDSPATVQLLTTLKGISGGTVQPVTSAPELGNVKGSPVVFVGTGMYLGSGDVTSTNMQSFYAIKDTLEVKPNQAIHENTPRANTCPNDEAKSGCFMQTFFLDIDVTGKKRKASKNATYNMNFATMGGWFIDLQKEGERVVSKPDLQLGIIAFTSIMPRATSACSRGGASYLNYLDYATGVMVKNATEASILVDKPTSGTTLTSGLEIIRGKTGRLNGQSNGPPIVIPPPPPPSGTRHLSWRELITD